MGSHAALEQAMMRLEEPLRLRFAGALDQLGRVHQIGEQQGYGGGAHVAGTI